MKKIDHKKELKNLYTASAKQAESINVPDMNFLMVDGFGNPNTSQMFQDAVSALFGISYTLKFMVKKSEAQIDYSVMPLEGLWWMDDMSKFSAANKDDWKWTVMIMQPEFITSAMVDVAIADMIKRKKISKRPDVRFEKFIESNAAQLMHIGPYSEEEQNIIRVHNFITSNGNSLSGKHHEIYLSDFRRTTPERLKTIIRQPFD